LILVSGGILEPAWEE